MGWRTSRYRPVDTTPRLAGISPKLRPSDSLPPMTTIRPTADSEHRDELRRQRRVRPRGATSIGPMQRHDRQHARARAAIDDAGRAATHRQHDDERLGGEQQQAGQAAGGGEVEAEPDRQHREHRDDRHARQDLGRFERRARRRRRRVGGRLDVERRSSWPPGGPTATSDDCFMLRPPGTRSLRGNSCRTPRRAARA